MKKFKTGEGFISKIDEIIDWINIHEDNHEEEQELKLKDIETRAVRLLEKACEDDIDKKLIKLVEEYLEVKNADNELNKKSVVSRIKELLIGYHGAVGYETKDSQICAECGKKIKE